MRRSIATGREFLWTMWCQTVKEADTEMICQLRPHDGEDES
jgi:hypothetical protein